MKRFTAFIAGVALAIAGCGGGDHKVPYKTLPRPALEGTGLTAPNQKNCPHIMGGCLPHPQGAGPQRPTAISHIKGPDFSNNDPVFSRAGWHAIAHNNNFAYLKSTEGVRFFDATAGTMAALSKAFNLPVGGYDFLHLCYNSASDEALHFVSSLHRQGLLGKGTLPPAGDMEYGGGCNGRSWTSTWVGTVYNNDGHICPIMYSGAWFWQPNLGNYWPTCRGRQLKSWISGYNVNWPFMPSGVNHLDMWQSSDHGANGYNAVDLSYWMDGSASFHAFANLAPAPKPRTWLQTGDRSAAVWVFIHRLVVAGWFSHGGSFYSKHVAQVVKQFQHKHHLNPVTGYSGARTQAAVKRVAEYDKKHHTKDVAHPMFSQP